MAQNICCFKKINGYITRLPLVIQKMHNENKCVHSYSKHPQVKTKGARIIKLKGFLFFLNLICHPRQDFIDHDLHGWKYHEDFISKRTSQKLEPQQRQ
jgi:hypothetical protein